MMDTTSLIGGATDAYSMGLQARGSSIIRKAQDPETIKGFDVKAARTTAENFESFFVGQMLEYMTQGVEVDPEFGGGHAEEMWRSMMNQEYGKHIAKSGGLGIADQVMASMIKAQEERTTTEQKLSAMNADAAGSTALAAQLRR